MVLGNIETTTFWASRVAWNDNLLLESAISRRGDFDCVLTDGQGAKARTAI
jgi:hypothetical protein